MKKEKEKKHLISDPCTGYFVIRGLPGEETDKADKADKAVIRGLPTNIKTK